MSPEQVADAARTTAHALPPLTDDQVARVAALLSTVPASSERGAAWATT